MHSCGSTMRWLILTSATMAITADAGWAKEWPSWRGPKRDGIAPETGLLKSWTEDGPPLLWRAERLGNGYSSVAIAKDRIVTLGQRQGTCQLIAIARDGSKELWATDIGSGSPNCTPTIDGDLVYALGRNGDLLCARLDSGEAVWRKSFSQDFGGKMMSGWGFSESPLVDGEKLVCTPGSDDAMIVALNKRDGKLIWKAKVPDLGPKGNEGAAYSSIVISQAGGEKQYVQLVGKGLVSVAAQDGRFLWNYNRIANGTANIPTPIIKDNYVFCSTGYGTGAALLEVRKQGNRLVAEEKYFLNGDEMQNHHGGMILYGDHVYCGHGHNNGFPVCMELKTGVKTWGGKIRGAGSGSAAVVLADGHLYFRYQDGKMALIEANPKEYRLKGSFELASKHGESWPHPVIVDGLMYIRDQGTLLCYDVRAK